MARPARRGAAQREYPQLTVDAYRHITAPIADPTLAAYAGIQAHAEDERAYARQVGEYPPDTSNPTAYAIAIAADRAA